MTVIKVSEGDIFGGLYVCQARPFVQKIYSHGNGSACVSLLKLVQPLVKGFSRMLQGGSLSWPIYGRQGDRMSIPTPIQTDESCEVSAFTGFCHSSFLMFLLWLVTGCRS